MKLFAARRHCLFTLLTAACGTITGVRPARAAAPEVWLVLSSSGGIHASTAGLLQEIWEREGRQPVNWRIGTWSELLPTPATQPQLIVTLGSSAYLDGVERAPASVLLQRVPVLAALLPQAAFPAATARGSWRTAAVLLDQPVERIAHLLRLALPDHVRVGVLLGPDSSAVRPHLARALAVRGFKLVTQSVAESGPGFYPALRTLLDEADLLLVMPDKFVFQSENMHNVLLTAYRQRIPVVSYSAAHARAGALLSLHTSPGDVARQVAEAVRQWLAGRGLPAPALAESGSVAVNEQVARSLGLSLPSALTLERALLPKELAP